MEKYCMNQNMVMAHVFVGFPFLALDLQVLLKFWSIHLWGFGLSPGTMTNTMDLNESLFVVLTALRNWILTSQQQHLF